MSLSELLQEKHMQAAARQEGSSYAPDLECPIGDSGLALLSWKSGNFRISFPDGRRTYRALEGLSVVEGIQMHLASDLRDSRLSDFERDLAQFSAAALAEALEKIAAYITGKSD